jgi:hypothetical protein
MNAPPPWIVQFAKLLKDRRPVTYTLVIGGQNFEAELGIRETLQFSKGQLQLLNRHIEYRLFLPSHSQEIPLSCQLYLDENDHWRLFLFTRDSGMLLSVNLTTIPPGREVVLKQKMKIVTQSLSWDERERARDALVSYLEREGFKMEGNDLVLGTYNRQTGNFTDINPERFIMDFLRAGTIKGHFMANKGYIIPWLG